MNGLFITMEGPDGSGKSTVTRLLTEYLKEKGYEIVITREPGGTRISENIRNMILDNRNYKMSAVTEALLYAASRAQHVHQKIKPALEKGKVIICERFVDSSLVYQGIGRKLGIEKIKEINDFATQNIEPDITIFFDIPPELAADRRRNRRKKDRLEKESITFHKEVYKGYVKLAKMYPERITVIDATQNVDNTFKQVQELVEKLLINK